MGLTFFDSSNRLDCLLHANLVKILKICYYFWNLEASKQLTDIDLLPMDFLALEVGHGILRILLIVVVHECVKALLLERGRGGEGARTHHERTGQTSTEEDRTDTHTSGGSRHGTAVAY